VPVPVPIPVPQTIPKVGDIQHGLDWVRGKVNRLGKLGTIAGLIGLVAGSLARLGINWARCSRVNKVGRRICGLNDGLLDGLLADLLLVTSIISVVEFAKELQAIEGEVVSGLERFVREI
jgi:hypothetical protein